MKLRSWLVVGVVAVGVWPMAAFGAAASVSADASTATPTHKEVALRQALGLRSDNSYITSVDTTIGKSPQAKALDKYGIFMTKGEQAEIDFRSGPLERAASDPPLNAYLNASHDFAGKYIDHQLGGKLVVMFTGDVSGHVAQVAALFPYHDRLVFHTAAHSLSSLESVHQRIDADIPELQRTGLTIAQTGVDVPHNQLIVMVTHLDESVRSVFANRYGKDAPIVLYEGARPHLQGGQGTDAPPFRGGQEITRVRAQDQTLIICTSGFIVRHYTGGLASSYAYYMLTAAHCGTTNMQWTQGAVLVGTTQYTTWGVGPAANSDAALIPIPDSQISDQVMRIPTVNDLVPYGQSKDGDNAGDTVCLSGTFSGYGCTILDFTNITVNWAPIEPDYPNGELQYHIRETDAAISKDGDSGGSWYNPNYQYPFGLAVGTHTGIGLYGTSYRSIYAQIGWDFYDLNQLVGGAAVEINSTPGPLQ